MQFERERERECEESLSLREMEPKVNNNNNDDAASSEECRERRRRRIMMRRIASPYPLFRISPATPQEPFDLLLHLRPIDLPNFSSASSRATTPMLFPTRIPSPPVYALLALAGRSQGMEDAVSVVLNLCSPPINRGKPLHFFGLYDGHGGSEVSGLCRDTMHVLMEEELMRVKTTDRGESSGSSRKGKGKQEDTGAIPWRMAISKCFERMDQTAMSHCFCGNSAERCSCHPVHLSLSGSTALVAMLTPDFIIVANCGDSRAVLCRAGKCVPMSFDHKPDRSDELARIKAAGGRVLYSNGARVEGILAMSRAIGDKFLKMFVTCEPEIRFIRRHPKDECLILASDGLWDVVTSQLACEIASKSLQEDVRKVDLGENNFQPVLNSEGTGFNYPSSSASTATVLARLALSRNSTDNISIIVVDLRR